jgi:hypothetical protein
VAVLSTAPVLAFPLPDAPYVMDTDASLTGIGAVLSQVVEGKEMVLGYWSRSLSKEERNYCMTRRELLAVVEAFEHFHCYIYGRKFPHPATIHLDGKRDGPGPGARRGDRTCSRCIDRQRETVEERSQDLA